MRITIFFKKVCAPLPKEFRMNNYGKDAFHSNALVANDTPFYLNNYGSIIHININLNPILTILIEVFIHL